jgi:ComF family protein
MPRHVFYELLRRYVAAGAPARLDRLLDATAHFVLPAWCAGCDARLPWRPSPLGLCATCARRLPPPPPAPRLATLDGLIAAWSYRPPIDEVVRRLKYGRLEYLAGDLAVGMAAAAASASGHDYITAVPLHWRRRLERGYDQAALLAASVASRISLPYRATLVRSRATPPQAARSAAARKANVAGAFRCRAGSKPALRGVRVLLVDDVATTGATLEAAGRALKQGGAARVTALVAALTPPFATPGHPRYNREPGLG